MEHKTPCPSLEQLLADLREATQTLQRHERELGGVGANMTLLLDGQKRLFFGIDELTKVATRNETNIGNIGKAQEELSDKIGNGLKDEIAKSVISHAKGDDGLAIEKRFEEIERFMWLPRMFDTKMKKWVIASLTVMILLGIIFIIAFSSASMWGYFKETKWGETKGLMKSMAVDQDTHSHKATDGSVFIHTHEKPDGTPVKK